MSNELNAELYDLTPHHEDRPDIKFYVDMCQDAEGDVLELGCGTGRILIPIARQGNNITGLDISKNMLTKCEANLQKEAEDIRKRVNLSQGSMADFSIDKKFDRIIIPFRALSVLLNVKDQLSCLQRVRDHLSEKGKLIFDVFTVDMAGMIRLSDGKERTEFDYNLPDGRKFKRTYRYAAQHPSEQYNDVELIYYVTDTRGRTERLVDTFKWRYFFRFELEHLLVRAGFRLLHFYGDFDKSLFTDNSPEMILIAEKK